MYWYFVKEYVRKQYFRDFATNSYVALDGETLLGPEDSPIPASDQEPFLFGPIHTFQSQSWQRFTSSDLLNFDQVNDRWDNRQSQWHSPISWLNLNERNSEALYEDSSSELM